MKHPTHPRSDATRRVKFAAISDAIDHSSQPQVPASGPSNQSSLQGHFTKLDPDRFRQQQSKGFKALRKSASERKRKAAAEAGANSAHAKYVERLRKRHERARDRYLRGDYRIPDDEATELEEIEDGYRRLEAENSDAPVGVKAEVSDTSVGTKAEVSDQDDVVVSRDVVNFKKEEA
ncbi:hypothetical protein IAT38_004193 [Cryptococcus sp. DSM 104549]